MPDKIRLKMRTHKLNSQRDSNNIGSIWCNFFSVSINQSQEERLNYTVKSSTLKILKSFSEPVFSYATGLLQRVSQ
jgi:hypothetical protein